MSLSSYPWYVAAVKGLDAIGSGVGLGLQAQRTRELEDEEKELTHAKLAFEAGDPNLFLGLLRKKNIPFDEAAIRNRIALKDRGLAAETRWAEEEPALKKAELWRKIQDDFATRGDLRYTSPEEATRGLQEQHRAIFGDFSYEPAQPAKPGTPERYEPITQNSQYAGGLITAKLPDGKTYRLDPTKPTYGDLAAELAKRGGEFESQLYFPGTPGTPAVGEREKLVTFTPPEMVTVDHNPVTGEAIRVRKAEAGKFGVKVSELAQKEKAEDRKYTVEVQRLALEGQKIAVEEAKNQLRLSVAKLQIEARSAEARKALAASAARLSATLKSREKIAGMLTSAKTNKEGQSAALAYNARIAHEQTVLHAAMSNDMNFNGEFTDDFYGTIQALEAMKMPIATPSVGVPAPRPTPTPPPSSGYQPSNTMDRP